MFGFYFCVPFVISEEVWERGGVPDPSRRSKNEESKKRGLNQSAYRAVCSSSCGTAYKGVGPLADYTFFFLALGLQYSTMLLLVFIVFLSFFLDFVIFQCFSYVFLTSE